MGWQKHPTVYHYGGTGEYSNSKSWQSDTFCSALYSAAAIKFLSSSKAINNPFYC